MWFSPSVVSAATILLGASLICAVPGIMMSIDSFVTWRRLTSLPHFISVPNAASQDHYLDVPQEYSLFNRIQGTHAVTPGPYDKDVTFAERFAVLGE